MTESQLHNNPQSASDIVWLFGGAGLDITDVRVSESKAWKELASRFGNNQIPATLPGGFRRYNTTLIRSGLDDKGSPSTVSFDLEEESDGTQKLFALCAPLFSALSVGRVLLIDELDARLHPILTKWLIRAFQLSLKNPMGAQIVFTTHDDNLLDLGLFRRDQIWFVEKDEGGASKLYSLWDFRPRREKNIRNGYMAGLYGGIPFIPESIVRHD
jgi:hypothetical protein